MEEAFVHRSTYAESLLDFPAFLAPIMLTSTLTGLYGALALWLIRAFVWELRHAEVHIVARKCCLKGKHKARPMDNQVLVLGLACSASVCSLLYVAFYFLDTLLNGWLHMWPLTFAASIANSVLGAMCDSLWFAAMTQLVAFWLELLASMRSVKVVKKCCWFSIVTTAVFSTTRIGAAVAAPFSLHAKAVLLVVALSTAWIVIAVGTIAALRLFCHMRNMIAKNRAAEAIRVKMFRMCRFLAVNGALFVFLNLALIVNVAGTSYATTRDDPLATLAWEAPTRLCRFLFYVSLAWSCSSSSRRPTARAALHARSQSVRLKTELSLRSIRSSIDLKRELKKARAAAALYDYDADGCDNEDNEVEVMHILDSSMLTELSRLHSLNQTRRATSGHTLVGRRGGYTLAEIYDSLEANAKVRDRSWMGKRYRGCAEAQEMLDWLVTQPFCREEETQGLGRHARAKLVARVTAVEICRELQRQEAIAHVWGTSRISRFRDTKMFFRFCLVKGAAFNGDSGDDGFVSALDLSIVLTPKSSMLSLVELSPRNSAADIGGKRTPISSDADERASADLSELDDIGRRIGMFYYDEEQANGLMMPQGPFSVQEIGVLLVAGELNLYDIIREGVVGEPFPVSELGFGGGLDEYTLDTVAEGDEQNEDGSKPSTRRVSRISSDNELLLKLSSMSLKSAGSSDGGGKKGAGAPSQAAGKARGPLTELTMMAEGTGYSHEENDGDEEEKEEDGAKDTVWFYEGIDDSVMHTNTLHGPYTLLSLAKWLGQGRVLPDDFVMLGRDGDPMALKEALAQHNITTGWWHQYKLEVGSTVRHPNRGVGRVVAIDNADDNRVAVEFTRYGDVHRYTEPSWAKFIAVGASEGEQQRMWGARALRRRLNKRSNSNSGSGGASPRVNSATPQGRQSSGPHTSPPIPSGGGGRPSGGRHGGSSGRRSGSGGRRSGSGGRRSGSGERRSGSGGRRSGSGGRSSMNSSRSGLSSGRTSHRGSMDGSAGPGRQSSGGSAASSDDVHPNAMGSTVRTMDVPGVSKLELSPRRLALERIGSPRSRSRSGSIGAADGMSPIVHRVSGGRPRSGSHGGGGSPRPYSGTYGGGGCRRGSYGGGGSPRQRHSSGRPRSRGTSGERHSSASVGRRSSLSGPAPTFVARPRSDSSDGSDYRPRERRVSSEWSHLQGAINQLEKLAIRRLEGGELIGPDIGLGLSDMSTDKSTVGATSGEASEEDSDQEPVFERRRSSVAGASRRGSGISVQLSALAAGWFGRRQSEATAAPESEAEATRADAEHQQQSEAARRASALWASSGEVTPTMDFNPTPTASPPRNARRAAHASAPVAPPSDTPSSGDKAAFYGAFARMRPRASTTGEIGIEGAARRKPPPPRRSPPTATRAPLAPHLSRVTLVTPKRKNVQLKHDDGGSANSLPGLEFLRGSTRGAQNDVQLKHNDGGSAHSLPGLEFMRGSARGARNDVQLKHDDGGSAHSLPGLEFLDGLVLEHSPGTSSRGTPRERSNSEEIQLAGGSPAVGHRAPHPTPTGRCPSFIMASGDPDGSVPAAQPSPIAELTFADLRGSLLPSEKLRRTSSPPMGASPASVAGARMYQK